MVDDDLFDSPDDSGDFDPFSDMESDEPVKKRGGSAKKVASGGRRTLDDFNAEVDRRIAVLRSVKQPNKVRIAAAKWLGESGDIRAIKALVQVYRHAKTSRGLRAAAKKALSHYKALDEAIFRDPNEDVEDALGKEENLWVVELLQELAFNEERPRSRGRTLLLMNGVLAILLALLFVIFQNAPTDAVSIDEFMSGMGLGDGSTAVPTATETPAVDEFGNPFPTAMPTFTPTATFTPEPTFTPTATEVTLDHVRLHLRDMYGVLSRVDTTRGMLDQLRINWDSIRTDPSAGPRLCIATPPQVPDDVVLPVGVPEREPALAEARDWINTGLSALRDGWRYWNEGCVAGNLPSRINLGQQSILVSTDAFNMARSFLNLITQ